MTIYPYLTVLYILALSMSQQQLDQLYYVSLLWTKTKERMQSYTTPLRLVGIQMNNLSTVKRKCFFM